jgi:hypothetical protein
MPVRPPLSRRSFLKVSAALGASLGWPAASAFAEPRSPGAGFAAEAPKIAAALPLPGAVHLPVGAWPERPPAGFDLLLVPAHKAAAYIRLGRLLPLPGPRGRAHDPDGAFTWPYAFQVAALSRLAPGRAAHWAAAWQSPSPWPLDSRLVIGAALLRRGYSPNDAHAGHLAEVEADLLDLAPRLAASAAPSLAFGWVDLAAVSARALPLEGTPLVEYDWVIPRGAPDPAGAQAYATRLPPAVLPAGRPSVPLIPLMPLPPRAAAHHAALWRQLNLSARTR